MEIGLSFAPDTKPFLVFKILSKDRVVLPLVRWMTIPSFPILKPFLSALLMLNRFTQSSGTYLTS
jgi:hypothetical protein